MPDSKFRNDLVFNFASFFVIAISGATLNLIISVLRGGSDLGLFNQAFAIYLIGSQISVAGLQFSTLRQVSILKDDLSEASRSVASSLTLGILFSSVVCFLITGFSDSISDLFESEGLSPAIKNLAIGLFLYPLNKILLMVVNGFRHMRAYAMFNASRHIMLALFVLILLIRGHDATDLTIAFTVTEIVLFVGFLTYLRVSIFTSQVTVPKVSMIVEHGLYSMRAVFGGVMTEFNTRVDLIMLGLFMSDKTVGLYSFAATLAEGFRQIPTIMRWNLDPIIGEKLVKNRTLELQTFLLDARKKYIPWFVLFCIAGVIGYPLGLKIFGLYGEFYESIIVFAVLMSSVALASFYLPYGGLLLQGNLPGLQSYITLGVILINIVLNFFLIPIIGMLGAAISTSIALLFEALMIRLLARRRFSLFL